MPKFKPTTVRMSALAFNFGAGLALAMDAKQWSLTVGSRVQLTRKTEQGKWLPGTEATVVEISDNGAVLRLPDGRSEYFHFTEFK